MTVTNVIIKEQNPDLDIQGELAEEGRISLQQEHNAREQIVETDNLTETPEGLPMEHAEHTLCPGNASEILSGDGDHHIQAEGSAVALIRSLLGTNAVLLPIPPGQKGPRITGWQNTTVAQMSDTEYLQQLEAGNIGVLLGNASGGLCAIDIDDDAAVEPFLALNPLLRGTLRTKGSRGVQIWVKVDGYFPRVTKIMTRNGDTFGEWRGDGAQSVIYGTHPDGVSYSWLVEANPVHIRFAEINWPEELKLPWLVDEYEKLVAEHGAPYLIKKGTLLMNDYFFVVRFQREHHVLWEPLETEFYLYDQQNGLWKTVTPDSLKWQFGLDMKRADDEVGAGFLWKRSDAKLTSLVNTLRGVVERRDAFKKRSSVIHCANGMLDLQSDPPRIMSFHPGYHSRNICPITFDPKAECPRFVNELLKSALDDDDIDLLRRWAGSVLLGCNPAQRILLLIGTAGGGKSTLIEIIEKIIGEQNVAQLRTKHLNKQFELFRYLGKTLLTGKDVNATFLSEDGADMIKALVGNDLLDAEKKNGNDQFQLRGNFNMAITCNSRLQVRLEGDTDAWRRRLMVINYTKAKPKERITEFADKLIAAEGAGILNWMIEGAVKYLWEIEEAGDFCLTDVQRDRTELLLAESDSVRQFVNHRVVACDGGDASVFELQEDYFEYCEEQGWQAVSPSDFKKCIPDLMLEIHHVSKRNDILRVTGNDSRATKVRGFKHVTVIERC